MPYCSVENCKVKFGDELKLIKVPKDNERKEIWANYLELNGRVKQIPKNFFICEKHFEFSYDTRGNLVRNKDPSVPYDIWNLDLVKY